MTVFVAIDGGTTGTRGGLYDATRTLLAQCEGAASNPVVYGFPACVAVLAQLAARLLAGHGGSCDTLAVGQSGARSGGRSQQLAGALGERTGARRVIVCDDLRPLLFANAGTADAVIAIAGTGSSAVAQKADGGTAFVGGRGSLFGDDGSAYAIGVAGLRAAAAANDGLGPRTALAAALPAALKATSIDALVGWAQSASKGDVAALAQTVAAAADAGDEPAQVIIVEHARRLACQAEAAARKLGLDAAVPLYMHGALLRGCARYRSAFIDACAELAPALCPQLPNLHGHRAVLELALADPAPRLAGSAEWVRRGPGPAPAGLAPTETRAPSAPPLDALTASEIAACMNVADMEAAGAVGRVRETVSAAIEAAANALSSGGRIIHVGAGTSGRLGVLDASECPPTFGVAPDRVVGLVAGGEAALRASIEGAEDDVAAASTDLQRLTPPVSSGDFVIGIAASGTTPYVTAALTAARCSGAGTALVCCNPACVSDADIVVALDTGAEVLPGSTRLKAGTATKMVLNAISTGAMARAGYVFEGWMVGMRPVNAKLRARAARILAALTGATPERAAALLPEAGDDIRCAVLMARLGLGREAAVKRLEAAAGNLRRALHVEEDAP